MERLGEEEVSRILDALCEQGNAEEVSIWCWMHICCDCSHTKQWLSSVSCLDGRYVDVKER
jgi:hypothetical protein